MSKPSPGMQMNDDDEYEHKLEELDRLLNDPDVPMEPDRVWSLLAEISIHDLPPEHAAA